MVILLNEMLTEKNNIHPPSLTIVMSGIVDKSYFTELKDANPETLCRNKRCSYNTDKEIYSLDVWGVRYLLDAENLKIEQIDPKLPLPHEYFTLFIIYYLLRVKHLPLNGEWISEKDIPGGPTFFRGPHLIPTELISGRFKDDLDAFKRRCKSLGGTPLELADVAYRFEITPDIPIAILYWVGDEDFPAEAKLLYDRSIIELLSLDILYALAVGVCSRVGQP